MLTENKPFTARTVCHVYFIFFRTKRNNVIFEIKKRLIPAPAIVVGSGGRAVAVTELGESLKTHLLETGALSLLFPEWDGSFLMVNSPDYSLKKKWDNLLTSAGNGVGRLSFSG